MELFQLVRADNAQRVRAFISDNPGIDLNMKNEVGQTPLVGLFYEIFCKGKNMLIFLISTGQLSFRSLTWQRFFCKLVPM